jgi:hypothetical protein
MKSILKVILVLNILLCSHIYSSSIKNDKKIFSPDGKSYIFISDKSSPKGGTITYYNIYYKGKNYLIENNYTPTYRIQWSKDSNRIYTMNHVYKETIVQMLNFSDNNWELIQINPPFKSMDNLYWTATGWKIEDKYLTIACAYIKNMFSNKPLYYIGEFKYDIFNDKSYDIKSRETSFDNYVIYTDRKDVAK